MLGKEMGPQTGLLSAHWSYRSHLIGINCKANRTYTLVHPIISWNDHHG